MKGYWKILILFLLCSAGSGFLISTGTLAAGNQTDGSEDFPRSLDSYNDAEVDSIFAILKSRAEQEPFNLIATLIFLCAIIHTFLSSKFMGFAHRWEHDYEQKKKKVW
jgi:hypothetical protein